MSRSARRGWWGTSALALLALTACTGAGTGPGPAPVASSEVAGERISVLMVDDRQMVDLQTLTADGFTAQTGIEVDYTVLPPEQLREELASPGGTYDVVSLTDYEVPIYAENGWLAPLDEVVSEPEFDVDDFFPSILQGLTGRDGKLYGVPFYGESSFLMYRADVFEELGLTMPEHPTWQEVAELADEVDRRQPGMAGICLRGEPGWDELVAPLTTVVNTFGGTWFEQDWTPRLDGAGFSQATDFYVDLLRENGLPEAADMGFDECLVAMQQGEVGIWYDATSAASSLESMESPVKGDIGYVQAPVVETESSGWLHSWAWSMPVGDPEDEAAAEFITWASGREYEELVGAELGWARVPAGKRMSTYRNEEYLEDASAFALPTVEAIRAADPRNPGTQPRPTTSIQFVEIPEFIELGRAVSQEVSDAIARKTTVEAALARSQELAEKVAQQYRQAP